MAKIVQREFEVSENGRRRYPRRQLNNPVNGKQIPEIDDCECAVNR